MIFTFYSFKGGVGRSMALLNTAYGLVAKGRNVLVLDMDLEAPGISGFMSREKEIPHFARHDMLDLLQWAKETAPHVSEDAPLDPSSLPPLTDYAVRVPPEKLEKLPHKHRELGRLDVIPIEVDRNYYERVPAVAIASMDRDTLLRVGSLLRSWLKSRRIALDIPDYYGPVPEEDRSAFYDYVLIDSRTGSTEVGGLCIGPLSDQLVVLCGLNDQNVEDTRHFLIEVGVLQSLSETPPKLGKPTLFVASPVPTGELTLKKERLNRLTAKLGPIAAELTYHPQMALMETIFVRDYLEDDLTLRYWKLLDCLLRSAPERDDGIALMQSISSMTSFTSENRNLVRKFLRSELVMLLFIVVNTYDLQSETLDANFQLLDRICRALANDDSTEVGVVYWSKVLARWSECSTDAGLAERRFSESINRINQIIDNPKTSRNGLAKALHSRALRFGHRNESERAIEDYTAVIEMSDAPTEQKAKSHSERGWCHFLNDRILEAIVDFRQAIALNAKFIDARRNLAIALLVDGQVSEALDAYDSAIELADAADLTNMEKDLADAIAKRGSIAGADVARQRIESRAASLSRPT